MKVNSDKSQVETLSDCCRKFGRYVEKLRFECCLHPNAEEVDSDDEDGEDSAAKATIEDLPRHLQNLLNGQLLPNMTTLEVLFLPENNFGYDEDWGPSGDLGSIYIHDEGEDSDTIQEREGDYIWRSTVNQVFTSMAENQSITRLELLDLLPKACSVFEKELWSKFLGGLDELKIELWGGDNGAGWHSNTTEGYLCFIADVGRLIFDNLASLKRLEFMSDAQNPAGCEGMRHSALPFRPDTMGNLEELDLWNCFIDPKLLEFLKTKSGQLRKVRLFECFSAGEDFGLAENGITWSKFFSAWCEANPVCEELVVYNSKVPLTSEEQFERGASKEEEPDDVKAVREALRRDTRRKLFSYGYLDDKYGMVFCNEEANIERFEQGDDQKKYDTVMEIVAQNRKTKSLTPTWPEPSEFVPV